jgi:general secretion pathway protein I
MSARRGFTLLEIMVALAIFAILAVAFGRQTAGQLAGSRAVELRQVGALLAENELNRVLARKEWPPLGSVEVPATLGRARFVVRVVSSATEVPLLRRIEVSVTAGAGAVPGRELAKLVGFRGEHVD